MSFPVDLISPFFPLLIFGSFFLIVPLAFFFGWRGRVKREAELSRFARNHGLFFKKGGFFSLAKAIGNYKGFDIVLRARNRGSNGPIETELLMFYDKRSGVEVKRSLFSLPKHYLSCVCQSFLRKSFNGSSKEFNDVFSTRGDLARQVLTPEVQHLMLELNKIKRFHLRVDVPKNGGGVVTVRTQGKDCLDDIFLTRALELAVLVSKKM